MDGWSGRGGGERSGDLGPKGEKCSDDLGLCLLDQ